MIRIKVILSIAGLVATMAVIGVSGAHVALTDGDHMQLLSCSLTTKRSTCGTLSTANASFTGCLAEND